MSTSGKSRPGLWQVLKRSVQEFSADDMLTYAAALSYQVFFSLFPFVIFILALLGLLNIPGFFDTLLNQSRTLMPDQAYSLVEQPASDPLITSEGICLSLTHDPGCESPRRISPLDRLVDRLSLLLSRPRLQGEGQYCWQ
jgi:uncharacterized BrkB/YihY/UPF0761 family membrane protein